MSFMFRHWMEATRMGRINISYVLKSIGKVMSQTRNIGQLAT